MNLRSRVRLAHLVLYAHAALIVLLALIGGDALRDWLVPVAVTFPLTAGELLRVKRLWRTEQGATAEGLLGA